MIRLRFVKNDHPELRGFFTHYRGSYVSSVAHKYEPKYKGMEGTIFVGRNYPIIQVIKTTLHELLHTFEIRKIDQFLDGKSYPGIDDYNSPGLVRRIFQATLGFIFVWKLHWLKFLTSEEMNKANENTKETLASVSVPFWYSTVLDESLSSSFRDFDRIFQTSGRAVRKKGGEYVLLGSNKETE